MAKGITLAEAIDNFTGELGCFGTEDSGRKEVLREINEAIEYLMLSGGGKIWREWRVPVKEGRFTLPRDLVTPLKFKFSRLPHFGFGTFTTAYFSYSSNALLDGATANSLNQFKAFVEVRSNRVATQFRPPEGGLRLIATTKNQRDVGKCLQVAGKQRGFDIVPNKDGKKYTHEPLKIQLETTCADDRCYSRYTYEEITSIIKDETLDWVMLSGVDSNGNQYFLSHYHPDEEIPMYRECDLFGWPAFSSSEDVCMHIYGRIDPNMYYKNDSDILPISSRAMLTLLSKRAKYINTGDFKQLKAVLDQLQILIRREVLYFEPPEKNVNIDPKTSGAGIISV